MPLSEFEKRFQIEELFPTPIYNALIDLDEDYVSLCEKLYIEPDANNLFVEITDNQQILNLKEFKKLRDKIDWHVDNFYHNIYGYNRDVTLKMSSSWCVRSLPGRSGHPHDHGNSILSGVIYLNVPENSGNLVFKNFREDYKRLGRGVFFPEVEVPTKYNVEDFIAPCKSGLLILFPSLIFHKISKNESNDIRYSIAFNYFFSGEFKTMGAALNIK